jgi:hypothetical protein
VPIRAELGKWSHHWSHHEFSSFFPRGRVVSAPYAGPCRTLEAAHAADRRAGDRLAAALDEPQPGAPLMCTVGARLLTRAVANSDHSTAIAIASELQLKVQTLTSWIQRAGGVSIRQFRRERIVARLAAIAEEPGVPWPIAAEILGAPRTHTVLSIVRSTTNLPAGLWRARIRAESQLQHFRSFLRSNATHASSLVNSHRPPMSPDSATVDHNSCRALNRSQ